MTAGTVGPNLWGDDMDSDGMPDDWEIEHFGGLSQTDTNDWDGDGLLDIGEYVAETDPTNALCLLNLQISAFSSNIVISFETITPTGSVYLGKFRYYDLFDSTNLYIDDWNLVNDQTNISAGGTVVRYTNIYEEIMRFYHVKARLEP